MKHRHDLACMVAEQVADELADVVVDRAAFFHRRDDAGEVVVGQHQSAAPLLTSVPVMPIATPIRILAGASLTPSPSSPRFPVRLERSTTRSLCPATRGRRLTRRGPYRAGLVVHRIQVGPAQGVLPLAQDAQLAGD
jgi:hypothetical protein